MTPLLALLLAPTALSVAEMPRADADVVVVQAYVKAPPVLSDREQAAWTVLADVLYDGTAEFSGDRLFEYGSQAGVPLLIEPWPDFIKVQIVEPKDGLDVAGQIAEAIFKRASLTASAVEESVRRRSRQSLGPWPQALFDLKPPFNQVTRELVVNLYQNTFRADNAAFIVAGAVTEGEGKAEIVKRFSGPEGRPPRRTRFDRTSPTVTRNGSRVTTFEWRGGPLDLAKPGAAARVLSVFALGVGKEGSLHRVLREQKAVSYRQEAVMWPSATGWRPRLVLATTQGQEVSMADLKDSLTADIASWQDDRLVQARAMLATSLDGSNVLNPFWTTLGGTESDDLLRTASFAGINLMITGAPGVEIDGSLVTLDELKASARQLLEESSASMVTGG